MSNYLMDSPTKMAENKTCKKIQIIDSSLVWPWILKWKKFRKVRQTYGKFCA